MRIGEIRNTLKLVLNEANQIEVKHEVLYGGQAHQVNNFGVLSDALDIIFEQPWNKNDSAPIKELVEKHKKAPTVVLPASEFNTLNAYVNAINAQIPLYFSVIESLTEKQDQKAVNIRLPKGIHSFGQLNKVNERLDDIFKLVNVDGEFEFASFDKGTEWYTFVSLGILTHSYLFACLKVAQEYLKTRTEFFKSEQARLSYEASLRDDEKASEKGFEEFRDKWLGKFIESQITKVIGEIKKMNGKTEPELHTHLVRATTKLVQELGEGTEFHLSLNPPAYMAEQSGQLTIDYKKIQAALPQEKEAPKQLGNGDTPAKAADTKKDGSK